jgi:hypothetical protein
MTFTSLDRVLAAAGVALASALEWYNRPPLL